MYASVPLLAVGAGVTAHLLFFKRGEHFLFPLRYVQGLLLATTAGTLAQKQYGGLPLDVAVSNTFQVTVRFLAGIFFSLLVYRLFANPLNRFPGPFMTRLTKLSTSFRNANLDGHLQLQKLHRKYGKFVRIGPNDLSISDPDAVQVISAANSKCKKSVWYSQDEPLISMHTTRDRALHDRRRRVWSPAFSDKALRGYEERVQGYTDLLVKRLEDLKGAPANMSKWFNLYSFDVMGDLGFGKSFDMLQSGEKHWAITLLGEGMDIMGFSLPTWLFRSLVAIPGLANGYHKFIAFCSERLDERIKVQHKTDPNKPDITSFLIEQYEQSPNKKAALPMIQGDSRLIIVAGSDTTAAALCYVFHWLAKIPEFQGRLREDLEGKMANAELQKSDLLNGIIDEALRLNPPVPSGVFRETPPEGVYVGKTFIPGKTNMQMPTYVMGHDEDCYAEPESFIPERWYSRPELVKHRDAFGPFSTGPFGCIGKNLAYMEIRQVTAQIIRKFDVRFAPGEDGSALLMKTKDHFTLELADMNLTFDVRA